MHRLTICNLIKSRSYCFVASFILCCCPTCIFHSLCQNVAEHISEKCNIMWSTALSHSRWGGVPAPLSQPCRGNVTQTSSKSGRSGPKTLPVGSWRWQFIQLFNGYTSSQRSNELTVSCHFILNPNFCQHKCVACCIPAYSEAAWLLLNRLTYIAHS